MAATDERPWVLGISAGFHNGAVCLLHGDEVVVAIQEERLTREKRSRIYSGRRSLAIDYCLAAAGIAPPDLSLVVSCPILLPWELEQQDLGLNPALRVHGHGIPTLTIPHHLGHAVGAFAVSGFSEAAVLVVDGSGSLFPFLPAAEQQVARRALARGAEHVSCYRFDQRSFTPLDKHLGNFEYVLSLRRGGMPPFASLGHMFSSAALQIFDNYLEAGKVMGLAPYGEPRIPVAEFFSLVDGNFEFSSRVPERFRHDQRWPCRQAEYQDLAASVQAALEAALLHLVHELRQRCDSANLCYAGGVALNSVANERILHESGYRRVFIMPAAEDSGPAIGAAYYGLWHLTGSLRGRAQTADAMGRAYTAAEIDAAIAATPAIEVVTCDDPLEEAVRLLREGRIIGWFQGRSELGPRALGQRSILSDPRRADGKEVLNSRVKHRESFRPFAPAVLAEHVAEWFATGGSESSAGDFMLRVCAFHAARRREVPAVVHVDGTGRLQSVSPAANPVFHRLLERFFRATGVPMLLNTSFNVMGEPIVETPDDALWSLLDTGLDACVIGDRVVRRRPGFTSLLDLYPWCPASRYVLEFAANGGALSGELDHLQTASFEVEAPARGKVTPRIGPLLYGLLRHIDGRTSGRELLRKLTPAMDEPTLVWRLGMLRRALVVRFSVEPVAPDRDGAATAGEAARAPVLKGES